MVLEWTRMPSHGAVPTPRHVHSSVLYRNLLYVFGGYNGEHLSDIRVFDFEKLSWSVVEATGEPPRLRHSHSAVVHGHCMFVFGGIGPASKAAGPSRGIVHADLVQFDLELSAWSPVKVSGTPPSGRWGHSACVHGNSMFVFGGLTEDRTYSNQVYEYSFASRSWRRIETTGSPPRPRHFHSAVVYSVSGATSSDEHRASQSQMVVFGGYGGSGTSSGNGLLKDLYALDLNTKTWHSLTPPSGPMPSPRRGHTAVIHKGIMYIYGGRERANLADVHAIALSPDRGTFQWTEVACVGGVRAKHFHSAVMHRGSMWVFGGLGVVGSGEKNLDEFDRLIIEVPSRPRTSSDIGGTRPSSSSGIAAVPSSSSGTSTPTSPNKPTLMSSVPPSPRGTSSGRSLSSLKIRLKCYFENEIRLISVAADITADALISKLASEYKQPVGLQYRDEEGDMVSVRSQADLDEALTHFRVSSRGSSASFKVYIVPVRTAASGPGGGNRTPEQSPRPLAQPSRRSMDSNNSNGGTSSSSSQQRHVWEIDISSVKLVKKIGQGANGEVYRGVLRGTPVAVKKLLLQDMTEELMNDFRKEVDMMSEMRHPNICLYMGACTKVPSLCIVMEFLRRGSLYDVLRHYGTQLSLERKLRFAQDAARGILYLHSSNIVHRDLKSPNLLVDKNWVVKVCDFGLSRIKHRTYVSSGDVGTPFWMAPEVIRNEKYNEKADVYSYGVVCWELISGARPFAGMNAIQVIGCVGFQGKRLDIPPNTDPMFADLIRDCWHEQPTARPNMSNVLGRLEMMIE